MPVQGISHGTAGRKIAAVAAVMSLLLTIGCWVGWTAINSVEGHVTTDHSIDKYITQTTAPKDGATYSAENILVIGSDTRSGQATGSGIGSTKDSSGNGDSDTAFILHISADRKSVYALSLPRDSRVTRPGCKSDGSLTGSMETGKFNAAFSEGGRKCVLAAVEYLTHVPINHFVEVKIDGFQTIVDALGGVQVCTTHPLLDPIVQTANGTQQGTGLDLPKGTFLLNGKQALQLVRARHILGGSGSDLDRIVRQQKFMSAMVRGITSGGVLTNPIKLVQVLSAVAGALTVDAGLSGDALKTFLLSMQGVSPGEVKFYTVKYKIDGENVTWVQPDAQIAFTAMTNDTQYPPKAAGAVAGQPILIADPKNIQVSVLNGSGIKGLGNAAAKQLKQLGYAVTSVGNAPSSTHASSSITYDPALDVSVKTLTWETKNTAATAVTGQGRTMVLTVGQDWSGVRAAKITAATSGLAASDPACMS